MAMFMPPNHCADGLASDYCKLHNSLLVDLTDRYLDRIGSVSSTFSAKVRQES